VRLRSTIAFAASLVAIGLILAMGRELKAQVSKDEKAAHSTMAPLEQYLMDRDAEIALAKSAAPDSISRDSTVLVLGRHGYETAVAGTNGFVCLVDRSWMLPFDAPEFWNPRVRLPNCQNPPAARSHLPLTFKTTELALAGLSKTQMSDSIKAAFDAKGLPVPEPGSMCYMMSKQQYFGDEEGNAGDSHLMFWFPQGAHMDWGAEGSDSPVNVHQYSPQPITEFTISMSKWSDGTAVASNQH
jgi:hypothetical protein